MNYIRPNGLYVNFDITGYTAPAGDDLRTQFSFGATEFIISEENYTAPSGNSVDFNESESSYVPPVGDSIVSEFTDEYSRQDGDQVDFKFIDLSEVIYGNSEPTILEISTVSSGETTALCPPDWEPQSGNNLEINFKSCDVIENVWDEYDPLNLDVVLRKKQQTLSSENLNVELYQEIRLPDWKYQSGNSIFVDVTCCGNEPVLVEITGTAQSFVSLISAGEGELGAVPPIYGNSDSLVSIDTLGSGLFGIDGYSSITLSVSQTGNGLLEKFGNGSQIVSVTTTGAGTKETFGNGSTNVSLQLIASGYLEKFGHGTSFVSVLSSGSGSKELWGNGSNVVSVNATSSGFKQKDGYSNILVYVVPLGVGNKETFGNSNVPVSVLSSATGTKQVYASGATLTSITSSGYGYLEKKGNGNTTVTVSTTATGIKDNYAFGNSFVSVASTGYGIKDLYGNGNTVINFIHTGVGYLEKNGNSNIIVDLSVEGTGLKDNWTQADTTVQVITTGDGYKDNVGYSSAAIAVSTKGTARKDLAGYSNTVVSLLHSSFGTKDNWASNETPVKINVVAKGIKSNWGVSNTQISVNVIGSGYKSNWSTAGTGVRVDTKGSGTKDNWAVGKATINITQSGSGSKEMWGFSTVQPTLTISGEYWKEIWGKSEKNINFAVSGIGQLSPLGRSSITFVVESWGLGLRTGGVELEGDAKTTVSLSVKGTGVKQATINANGSTQVSINSYGTNISYPNLNGNGKPVLFTVSSTAQGSLKKSIENTDGRVPIEVKTNGTAIKGYNYQEIFGKNIETVLEIGSTSDWAVLVREKAALLLPPVFEPELGVKIKIEMVVDVENRSYEIRNVETNRPYLEFYGYDKWKNTLVVGDLIKDNISVNEEFDYYTTNRDTVLRKYGCSEVTLFIDIFKDYKFIKNPVNIKTLIDKEVDRAVLDAYALYGFEYE